MTNGSLSEEERVYKMNAIEFLNRLSMINDLNLYNKYRMQNGNNCNL